MMIVRNECPCREEFMDLVGQLDRPMLITNATSGSESLGSWTLEHLKKRWGHLIVPVCHEEGGENHFEKVSIVNIKFTSVVETLQRVDKGRLGYFLSQFRIADHFPEAIDEVCSIKCLEPEDPILIGLWLASAGSCTHLHWDSLPALLLLVTGAKTIRLFDPNQYEFLYPVPRSSKKLNWSLVDFRKPDDLRFPRYQTAASLETRLTEGDALFIPKYWWHCVSNTDTSIGVQYCLPSVRQRETEILFYKEREAEYTRRRMAKQSRAKGG